MIHRKSTLFLYFQVGFDATGKLAGVDITMYEDCGRLTPLNFFDSSLFTQDWFDNGSDAELVFSVVYLK